MREVVTVYFSAGNIDNIEILVRDFPPGEYSLTISVRETNGETVTLPVPSIPPLTGMKKGRS